MNSQKGVSLLRFLHFALYTACRHYRHYVQIFPIWDFPNLEISRFESDGGGQRLK